MYWNGIITRRIKECRKINRNMRCIEIGIDYYALIADKGLIETWDVLK